MQTDWKHSNQTSCTSGHETKRVPLAFLCSDDSIARVEREHDQDRDQSLQPLNLAFLETGLRQTECICFADSAMIYARGTGEHRSFFMRPPEYIASCCTLYIAARG